MYGMDRQLTIIQVLRKFSRFPRATKHLLVLHKQLSKATDLSKMIDKKRWCWTRTIRTKPECKTEHIKENNQEQGGKEFNITTPSTDLAKKYEGYKYSISPLKQTCETIMVFQAK